MPPAHLYAEEGLPLQQQHAPATLERQVVGGAGAHHTSTHDDDVGRVGQIHRFTFLQSLLWIGKLCAALAEQVIGSHYSATSVPKPSRRAASSTAPAAATSCTATPTDLKRVISSDDARPGLRPATISPSSA
jgi:hypothetical protein